MLSLKCDHPFECEFSIIFSTVKLKVAYYDITFPNLSIDSEFGLQFTKEIEIGIFEKPRLHFQIFPNSLKSLKIEIFVHLPSYFVKWWGWPCIKMCGVREEDPIIYD